MISVNIIGSGNVAHHLLQAFSAAEGVALQQIFSRKVKGNDLPAGINVTTALPELHRADVTVIAVSDSAIAEVSAALPYQGTLVVHTSGSMPMAVLEGHNRKGVFYPLQTFSKAKEINFSMVPLCLEAASADDLSLLKRLAALVSKRVYEVDSEQRKALHVAAVFVSNFTNNLYRIGEKICKENQLDFDMLKPLIGETAEKITRLSPRDAQTGPAIRHDEKTINAHLDFLKNRPERDIYELLTHSIQHD